MLFNGFNSFPRNVFLVVLDTDLHLFTGSLAYKHVDIYAFAVLYVSSYYLCVIILEIIYKCSNPLTGI